MGGESSNKRKRTYYTDGSGGHAGKDKRMRACGWGAFAIETIRSNDNPLSLCMCKPFSNHALWGEGEQTVPRSELTACIDVLAELTGDGAYMDRGVFTNLVG